MNNEKETSDLIGQRKIRIEKVNKLREIGIDPYPSKAHRSHYAGNILGNYEELKDKEVTVSGRLMSWREHGKLVFGDLQDRSGKIQLYIKADTIVPTNLETQSIGFDELKLIDIGDIVEAKGHVTKTQRGEVSVDVLEFRILTKAIRPLPSQIDGLKDKETIFRKRYLDTILNPEKLKPFEYSAKIVFALRQFLNKRGFLEMQTPILQPLYGGGTAQPFKTHVNALNTDFYLAIAHELYLKRLITAGYENVYNIAGYFRNEGIDRTHNPHFNMLETMTAYQNYEFNMELIEEMYKFVAENVFNRTTFKVLGEDVDFGKPWERIMMIDAVKKYAGYDFNEITTIEQAHKILDELGVKEKENTVGEVMVQVFEEKVEEKLIQPTFVYGHPVEISPLAKRMKSDERFVERFEIFHGGIEGGDNWSELNDPIELYERFAAQVDKGRAGADEFHPMDVEFLEAMEYGMPPTTGIGPGIERLVNMFTETEYIDDILFFPMMRPAPVTDLQREIYGEDYLEDELIKTEVDKNLLSNIKISRRAYADQSVIEEFPGIKFGYLVFENISIEKDNAKLGTLKRSIAKEVRERYDGDTRNIRKSIHLNSFRELYKSFGVDPNSRLNSAEAIIKRIVSGKGLYSINNLVDLYNATSAEFELPMAAYDLDQISGSVRLRKSIQGDTIIKIGDEIETIVDANELVYADDEGVVCLDYNYRDSQRTRITDQTKRTIVFIDGAESVSHEKIIEAMNAFASRVVELLDGKLIEVGGTTEITNRISQNNIQQESAGSSEAIENADISRPQDFSNRIAIVVNRDLENWQIANAVAHISGYMGHKLEERFSTGESFVTEDGVEHPRNAQYPIVVLAAKPGQMKNYMEKVRQSGNLYHGFIKEMIDTSDDEEITRILAEKKDEEIEYLGIGVFGDNDELKKLTNKFKLWS